MIRGIIGFLLALALPAVADDAPPTVPEHAERIVAIDWGMAETLVAIGAPPVGLAETAGYRDWVEEPALPADTVEIGLRAAPNLAYIADLKADVIVSTPQFASIEPALGKVAPVLSLEIYSDARTPYRNAIEATRRLGALTRRQARAEALIDDTETAIAGIANALDGARTKKVLIITFNDDLHAWVFGKGSLYDTVLKRAGLENAWTARCNFWGFTSISIDQIVGFEDVALLVVEPIPPSIDLKLAGHGGGALLQQMTLFEEGNYRVLPPVWGFGALPSARRFAEVLADNADFLKARDED